MHTGQRLWTRAYPWLRMALLSSFFLKPFYTSTNLSNRMITTHSLGEGSLLVMKLVFNKNMFKINKFFLLCTCTQHIGIQLHHTDTTLSFNVFFFNVVQSTCSYKSIRIEGPGHCNVSGFVLASITKNDTFCFSVTKCTQCSCTYRLRSQFCFFVDVQ